MLSKISDKRSPLFHACQDQYASPVTFPFPFPFSILFFIFIKSSFLLFHPLFPSFYMLIQHFLHLPPLQFSLSSPENENLGKPFWASALLSFFLPPLGRICLRREVGYCCNQRNEKSVRNGDDLPFSFKPSSIALKDADQAPSAI